MPRRFGCMTSKLSDTNEAFLITSLLRSVCFYTSCIFTFDPFEYTDLLSWRTKLLTKVCHELQKYGMDWTRADDDIAQERLSQVADHMSGATGSSSKKGKAALLEKNPDDVSTFQRCLMRKLRFEHRTENHTNRLHEAIGCTLLRTGRLS
jgi:hypothetical protein